MTNEADLVIEASEYSVFCADCVEGTFTTTLAEAEAWGAEHKAANHTDGGL